MNPFAELARPLIDRPNRERIPVRRVKREPRAKPVPRKIAPENPWGLSARQCAILDGLITLKTCREVAAEMGIGYKTLGVYVYRMKVKMSAKTILHAALMWDRYTRVNHATN